MGYITAGVNHKTAPISLREQVAFSTAQLPEALRDALEQTGLNELVILSTCNRTELYAHSNLQSDAITAVMERLIQWLVGYHQTDSSELTSHIYCFYDQAAVSHLMSVACGLDSMVLGEPQILGQLKTAYAEATQAGTVGSLLNRLFQYTFTTAKQIRTQTEIGVAPVSVAYAATRLAQQIFSDITQITALLIGAGDTIELTAQHLAAQKVKSLIVANRTYERARELTDQFGGTAVLLGDLPRVLPRCDMVISSTASSLPVLGKGAVECALQQRKHRPMFLVDMAVPRDIEPQVSELPDVYLYTVDDLNHVINDNRQQRQAAAKQAQGMIDASAQTFMTSLQALDGVDILRTYRGAMEAHRDELMSRALKALKRGDDPEQVLQQFARALTNKFMHNPSVEIKKAAQYQQKELLVWAATVLGVSGE